VADIEAAHYPGYLVEVILFDVQVMSGIAFSALTKFCGTGSLIRDILATAHAPVLVGGRRASVTVVSWSRRWPGGF
jgi:hypothetical protein